ncbi:hypothetical protein K435DRAFT_820047 [Dendrothele bispora CBS 962.96]|uniref:DUF6570 domain-containing protein n=1 Tax=Dendrothele bispora (strain CBS 962.96) TaxID=1314807 RepID=A0A4S8LY87_DENBC|nr:hypothetical protein K435DRAFT_820047 [Dendrothele bispora CBS 962.96]
MIARCRSKAWIIRMHEGGWESTVDVHGTSYAPDSQRGVRGHIIVYPQKPTGLLDLLPPPLEDVSSAACVIFVGSNPPTQEWLKQKATPLIFRKEKLRKALDWLKEHNPLYRHVRINHPFLDGLADEEILPVSIDHILPDGASASLTSRYDNVPGNEVEGAVLFERAVVTDVSGNESSSVLKRAASRHVRQMQGSYVSMPHGSQPATEFNNHTLFPMMYPTLFPYGLGGFDCPDRSVPVSMKAHTLSDSLFVLVFCIQYYAAA